MEIRNLLACITSATIVFSMLPNMAWAQNNENQDNVDGLLSIMETTKSGTCGDDLTWETDSDGTLTISGTGEMNDWSSESYAPWYPYRDNITKVIINGGVTRIGEYAFRNCSSLKSITIPSSVTDIGEYAFYNCRGLTSITIPGSVASIGVRVFAGCSELTDVTIQSGVTGIGDSAFEGCSKITFVKG